MPSEEELDALIRDIMRELERHGIPPSNWLFDREQLRRSLEEAEAFPHGELDAIARHAAGRRN